MKSILIILVILFVAQGLQLQHQKEHAHVFMRCYRSKFDYRCFDVNNQALGQYRNGAIGFHNGEMIFSSGLSNVKLKNCIQGNGMHGTCECKDGTTINYQGNMLYIGTSLALQDEAGNVIAVIAVSDEQITVFGDVGI